jgi:hypothetical protein
MRTIKFRALKDDMSNCNFVYGNLIYDTEGNPRIQDGNSMLFHTCIKGTEGQFTGILDNKGVEVCEGDIVRFRGGKKPKGESRRFVTSEVVYSRCMFTVKENTSILNDDSVLTICEVIGNIHETKTQ